jgi:hypothetical protein
MLIDLIGLKFSRLTVIGRAENTDRRRTQWLCRCECGSEKIVLGQNLRNGNTKSCGCLNADRDGPKARHGHAQAGCQSSTYTTWQAMIARCTNPKVQAYKWYGLLGVSVCDRWMSFENFLADMGERPVGTTLDRNENSVGYCKDNCRWADRRTQARNRRTVKFLTRDGKTMCKLDWARHLDIPYSTFLNRLKNGKAGKWD